MTINGEFHRALISIRCLCWVTVALVGLLAAPDASWGTITFTQKPSGIPNPVASGGTVNLSVTAVDSLGHTLNYFWTAGCVSALGSDGTFSDRSSQNPIWTAPVNTTGNSQACAMFVTASDGLGQSEQAVYSEFVTSVGSFALSVSISGTGTGTVATSQPPPQGLNCGSGTPNTGTCAASFAPGTPVTLTATPIGSSTFAGWGGDCAFAGTALTCSLTMNAPKAVTATFTQTAAFNLSVSVVGNGSVTSSPSGINCPSVSCSASFTAGTTVSLLANVTPSSTFGGWSGDCAGQEALCLVVMSGPKSATATFTLTSGTITGLTATPSVAQVGQPVTITVLGAGPCGGLALAFGDGGSTGLTGSLPLTTSHSYGSAGQFTLTATGVNNCTGFASTSLTVNAPTGTITVTVQRSDTRAPLQGATVTLTQGPSMPVPQITGSNGIATFANVVAGTYLATATLAGFQTNNATAVANANTTTPAFILLTPIQTTGTLTVTVRRSDTNAALAGATVALSLGPSSPPPQTTGGDGTTTFANLLTGAYTVAASLAGFQTNTAPATVSANTTTPVTVPLTPTQTFGTLAVTVRRSDTSAALSGATVSLSGGPSSPPAQTTAGDGTTTFSNLLTGSYTAMASLAGFQTNSAPATVSANTTTPVTVPLTPTQTFGTLTVTVRRSDTNAALAGATVALSGGPSSPPAQTTAGDGTTTFSNLLTGSYTVAASLAGFQTNSAPATVLANTTTPVPVLLTPTPQEPKRVVILVHGIFGSSATFGGVPGAAINRMQTLLEKTNHFKVFNFDYSALSDLSLGGASTSIKTIASFFKHKCIDNILKKKKGCGKVEKHADEEPDILEPIDTSSVDIVGHSMGGLVALAYVSGLAGPNYEGDIGKLITLATPFFGSKVADLGSFFKILLDVSAIQLDEMAIGSEFLWDLHQKWRKTDFARNKKADILTVVGTLGSPAVPGDKVVPMASAALPDLSIKARYVSKCHANVLASFCSDSDAIAFVDSAAHPSYKLVRSFLIDGTDPADCPAFECRTTPPSATTTGDLWVRFVDASNPGIPVVKDLEFADEEVLTFDPSPGNPDFESRGSFGTFTVTNMNESDYRVTVNGSKFFVLRNYNDFVFSTHITRGRTTLLPEIGLVRKVNVPFTVALLTTKTTFRLAVDTLSLFINMCCTISSAQSQAISDLVNTVDAQSSLVDGYVWVEIPGGGRFFLMPDFTSFTGVRTPVVASLPIQDFAGPILNMPIPDFLPTGTYTFFAVGVLPGSDPFNSANWVTNRAELSVTLTK